ncbi:MAG TPA: sugar transferase [Candidatus Mediterraneibacter faecipullorum]|uniref:Sugar transferase n=1 Tax=Candidatus Mediterraneibacter faecipullorum TaxID=2838670 RepID=A0A9D2NL51_9FIRM|nr:sugar transferase [Candidatus Mediterraneibacter faecipullorum]
MRKWENMPPFLKNDRVKVYYDILKEHEKELRIKRKFDTFLAAFMLAVIWPVFLLIGLLIKLDSPGPVFFKQERVTQYGRKFQILKFRTMVQNAEKMGSQITKSHDSRLTRVGRVIRGCRIDELPQLVNVLLGDMSFVGTRPEVVKYVRAYTDEMKATLLLPAGITSEASISYKDEGEMMEGVDDVDDVYIHQVLPEKMEYNLEALRNYSLLGDLRTMVRTVFAVLR